MASELLFPLLLFALVGSLTPGPNNIMLAASGVNYGFRRTVPHMIGICIGFPLMFLAVGTGLSQVFEKAPITHTALKLMGSVYLLWLAWRVATAEPVSTTAPNETKNHPISFLQAAAFQWVNPKAWILVLGATATYTEIDQALLPQVIAITLIFAVVSIFSVTIWTMLGVGIAQALKDSRSRRVFNFTMAAALTVSVLWILFE
jgi:threonine/homoserine/homoserine lactone efflux protein